MANGIEPCRTQQYPRQTDTVCGEVHVMAIAMDLRWEYLYLGILMAVDFNNHEYS